MEKYNLDGIDLVLWDEADALKRVIGKQEILKVLVAFFLSDMPVYAKALSDELAQKDMQAAAKSAHALKGVAGNLSTLALAEIVKRIELACRESAPLEELLRCHSVFEDIFSKTCAVLSSWQVSQH
tara:strand:+ start:33483 stop:33860 length:378 start_codon:yes stop_codon:yes gene_type:complete